MIDTEAYIDQLKKKLIQRFGTRLVYMGLQGSYLRGEATDSSDIDVMVVLEKLSVSDLDHYREIIREMDHFERSCGFICSKMDLANWNPLEIWQLLNGTKDCHGTLRQLVPAYTKEDIRTFVKLSLNNMYHEICHRYIHSGYEKNKAKLAGTYKGVFFILQNVYYLRNGVYIGTKAELLSLLGGNDQAVLLRSIELSNGIADDFPESFELLFNWCQNTLSTL